MKVTCQLEPSDYLAAQFVHIRPRPVFKWLTIGLILLAILIGLSQIMRGFSEGIKASDFIIFGGLAYLLLTYGAWLPYRSKKIFKQQKTLHEPYDVEITEDYFASTSSLGFSKISWSDFYKYRVGKDLILVYQSEVMFHMFPKRWFLETDYQKLTEILQGALGDPK